MFWFVLWICLKPHIFQKFETQETLSCMKKDGSDMGIQFEDSREMKKDGSRMEKKPQKTATDTDRN